MIARARVVVALSSQAITTGLDKRFRTGLGTERPGPSPPIIAMLMQASCSASRGIEVYYLCMIEFRYRSGLITIPSVTSSYQGLSASHVSEVETFT